MDLNISPRAYSYFLRAGFDPERKVQVDPKVPQDHPAYDLLSKLAGFHIGVGEDEEMLEEIYNDIAFQYTAPYGIAEWQRLLKTRLVGIAELHHRHGVLFVGDDERYYHRSGMHDAMGYVGTGFTSAIDGLLFGRSQPMIRPDQPSMTWYGIVFTNEDPRLYDYENPHGISEARIDF